MSQTPDVTGTALITGAARRIGRTVALALAESGWAVAIHYRRSGAEADALAKEINDRGGRARTFQADLADRSALDRLVTEVNREIGPLTALINNASEFLPDSIENLDETTWDLHLSVNLKAPVFLSEAMAKQLP